MNRFVAVIVLFFSVVLTVMSVWGLFAHSIQYFQDPNTPDAFWALAWALCFTYMWGAWRELFIRSRAARRGEQS